jgi:hypothetical protein
MPAAGQGSQGPAPTVGGSPASGFPPTSSGFTPPAAGFPPTPSGFTPQDRELLARSVQEISRGQAAMASRIAEELREIYRNLDLRPQIIPVPMVPPAVPSAPQAMMPQVSRAAWQSLAGVPPGLETAGIPRFAREEDLQEPKAGGGERGWEEGFAGLEPLPEDLEEATLEAAQPGVAQGGAPAAPVAPAEGAPEASSAKEGKPGATAAGDSSTRTGAAGRKGGLRRELKDYLARMREKLDGGVGKAGEAEKPAQGSAETAAPEAQATPAGPPELPSAEGPLALLEELGEYLPKRNPERRKNVFMRSDARMKLEYLKSRLDGRRGIKQTIEEGYAPAASSDPVTLQKVADAFIFIKELAGHYPDPSVGTMMQSKVDSILRRIKG